VARRSFGETSSAIQIGPVPSGRKGEDMSAKRFTFLVVGILLLLGMVLTVWADTASADVSMPKQNSSDSPEAGMPPTGPMVCALPFEDVQQSDYFYDAVSYLYCHGAVSGYADGTFRPTNFVTRAQICKIVVLALNIPYYAPQEPTFDDVPTDDPFYAYIESYWHYVDGSCADCTTFRPYSNTTRGQLAKIIVLSSCWPIYTPPTPTFNDVPADNTFYQYIETAYHQGIISGYADGTFRPYINITRGQVSKVIYRAMLQGAACATPTPVPTPKQ
jgi:S-layer homology domain